MELINFFERVITAKSGWFCLAHAKIASSDDVTKKSWTEEFYEYPSELPRIISRINQIGNTVDIYFSPYLFSERQSLKKYAITGRTIVADLDEAQILTLLLKPNVLVETSPDRHQGYWILKEELSAEEHEELSKKLTYSIQRCDKTGWFIGKKVRIPNTFNNKYVTGPKYIRVVDVNDSLYDVQKLEELYIDKEIILHADIENDLDWANSATNFDVTPQEMLAQIRANHPGIARIYNQYNILSTDRSTALWALMTSLFRAGLRREYVFYIAYNGINNKFKDLRYGGIRELAKDVLRAELAVKTVAPDIKGKINATRKLQGTEQEKSSAVALIIKDHLERLGTFIHTDNDESWFVREDTGKAMQVTTRNQSLETMMEVLYGVNWSSREFSPTVRMIYSNVLESPTNGTLAHLTYYNKDEKVFMLHTGKKDVLLVNKDSIERVNNGYNGIVFPWSPSTSNVINPKYQSLDSSWDEILFGDCLDNVMEIEKVHAQSILKIWFLSVLLKDGLSARPILALLGQPGSGKSTLFRRVYALMYGKGKTISAPTTEDNFDLAVSSDPLVVLDNVDTHIKWLPDRLAVMISPNEIQKRKLYTDNDVVVLKRNAMIGLTAHAPKFGREDITDRLLIFNFERFSHFKSETDILDNIINLRNGLWGAILQDIRVILNTKVPKRGHPQFRIEDFAIYGYWIATALGIEDEFCEGIETIRKSQKGFILEEDALILEALDRFIVRHIDEEKGILRTEFKSAGQMWIQLQSYTSDVSTFTKKYANAVMFGKKLWTMLDALREVYDVEWQYDSRKGSRLWSFSKKVDDKVGVV